MKDERLNILRKKEIIDRKKIPKKIVEQSTKYIFRGMNYDHSWRLIMLKC